MLETVAIRAVSADSPPESEHVEPLNQDSYRALANRLFYEIRY